MGINPANIAIITREYEFRPIVLKTLFNNVEQKPPRIDFYKDNYLGTFSRFLDTPEDSTYWDVMNKAVGILFRFPKYDQLVIKIHGLKDLYSGRAR